MKIKRADKIASLTRIYVKVQIMDIPLFNKLIIDEIGISGLEKVKQEAWRYPRNPKIFGEEFAKSERGVKK